MNQVIAQLENALDNPTVHDAVSQSTGFYSLHLPLFKIISIFLSVFFVAATIFFAIKTGWLALRVDRVRDVVLKTNMPKKRSMKSWQKVQRHFFAGDDNSLKMALLEADKILDEALRLAGFRGENLGDRLKKLDESKLPNIDNIWEAHKLRNRLAHESDFKLNRDLAERALSVYEQAFKDLRLLD